MSASVQSHITWVKPRGNAMLQVFYYALKAVVYPMAPVFDLQANDGVGALTPFCVKALKRIFLMSDLDKASTPYC